MATLVGVDVGGTFTDFVFLQADGRLIARKRASTPADSSQSVLAGVREALDEGLTDAGFTLAHGTTVATNALLERRGVKTALLTTQGFADVLEIGRQARTNLYSFHPTKPIPLLPRAMRQELRERVDWRGEVVMPLDSSEAAAALEHLKAQGVEAIAVCFLFSYLNPAHERMVGALARQHDFAVSLSCEIAPEPREYERASTTVANAYVMPIMTRYLGRLESQLREIGAASLRVMQSDGGALSAKEAGERAIQTALSGPAAGVVAASQCGEAAGLSRLLTFDMGGTSTDVALVLQGECPVVTAATLAGLPIRAPMLDIHTIGAGGGSLAYLDSAGGLRVGPQSAGADPGPVAYGKGDALTVTDANILLGRLPADTRLAGQLPLAGERVRACFAVLAEELGCAPEEAAFGIARVVNAAMARALRHISVERGHDPSEFTLLSFGGAGGLHACALAEALEMRSVLIPPIPGAFSALGLTLADVRREYARSVTATPLETATLPKVEETLAALFAEREGQAARDMTKEGFVPGHWQGQRLVELRYVGQSFALRVPLTQDGDLSAAVTAFHTAHRERYGHADSREPVEVVAIRLLAVGRNQRPRLMPSLPESPCEPLGETKVYGAAGWQSAKIYRREQVAVGQTISGPAILLQTDATTFLEAGWQARADEQGSLRLRR